MKKVLLAVIMLIIAFSAFQTNALQIIVKVNDSSSNITSANVFLYNSTDVGFNISTTTNSSGFAVFNNLSEQNYTINVSKSGYYFNSSQVELLSNYTLNITLNADSVNPLVLLNHPQNNSNISQNPVAFNFTATDDLDTSMACALYIDSSLVVSNITGINNTPTSINYSVSEGSHNWTVSCVDDSSNEYNATTIDFIVDRTNPEVSLLSPKNNFATNNTQIAFNWTAYDLIAPTVSCGLYINSSLNTTVSGNGTLSTTISNFNSGRYPFYVSCNDSANNTETSSTRYFNIDNSHNPEITLSLSDNNTQNATSVTLYATILSYSNITLVNYSFNNYSGNLSFTSGSLFNGTWTATITLTDEDENITVSATDYYNDYNTQIITYVIDDTAPTTNVSSFTVTNTSTGSLSLTWTNDDAEYLHRIYRGTNNFSSNLSSGTLIATLNEGISSYEDNSTIHGTMYYYAIVSVDQAGNYNESIYNTANNTPTDKTKPRIPEYLNVTRLTNNAMRLSWVPVTKDVTGNDEAGTITYYIYRGTSLPVSVLGAATLTTTSNYVDDTYSNINGNISGNNYYYAIVAEDYAGNKNTSATTTTNGTVGSSCSNVYVFGSYGSCSNGIKIREGTRYCYGLDYDNDIQEIEDDATCSVDEGDSGNDNPPKEENTTITSTLLATWNEISVDPYTYEIPKDDFSVKKIIWTPKASSQNGGIRLTAHSAKPSKVSVLDSKIFKYLEINHYGFELDNAIIEFYITNSWLALNDVSYDEVVLWHYDDGWITEETKFIRSEEEKTYFESRVTSFSVFAVGAKQSVPILAQTNVDKTPETDVQEQRNTGLGSQDENTEGMEEVVEESEKESNPVAGVIMFLITIIMISAITVYFTYYNPILGKKIWLKSEELYYKARKLKIPKKLKSDTERIEELQKKMEQARKEKEAARIPETEEEAIKKYQKRDRILRF